MARQTSRIKSAWNLRYHESHVEDAVQKTNHFGIPVDLWQILSRMFRSHFLMWSFVENGDNSDSDPNSHGVNDQHADADEAKHHEAFGNVIAKAASFIGVADRVVSFVSSRFFLLRIHHSDFFIA